MSAQAAGDSGVVRRHAGSGHRPRAQHRAGDAAEFHAAGRRLGQQALLEARHHPAGGGNDAAAARSRSATSRASATRSTTTSSTSITVREESGRVECAFRSRLLRDNRNYRFTWIGQVVSEIGDHFNNIAVLSLAMEHTQLRAGGDRRISVARDSRCWERDRWRACCWIGWTASAS